MNISFKKVSFIFITAMLITITITTSLNHALANSIPNGNQNQDFTERELTEKENEEIDYIFENIIITDENQNVVEIDTEKAEEYYGHIPEEIIQLEKDIQVLPKENAQNPETPVITPYFTGYANNHECFGQEITKTFGNLIPTSVIAAVLDGPINQKGIVKDLVRMGVKGNLVAIAAQMVYVDTRCLITYGPGI